MWESSYLFNLTPCATHPWSMCTVLQIHAFSLGNVGQSQYSLNGGAWQRTLNYLHCIREAHWECNVYRPKLNVLNKDLNIKIFPYWYFKIFNYNDIVYIPFEYRLLPSMLHVLLERWKLRPHCMMDNCIMGMTRSMAMHLILYRQLHRLF